MVDDELKTMVLDYMEKGFLENIIAMFRQDQSLCSMVADMISDERIRVRLGATALVEEMVKVDAQPFIKLIPSIGNILLHENPTVRGDAANLLDIIGHTDALPYLLKALEDENAGVREIAEDAVNSIRLRN